MRTRCLFTCYCATACRSNREHSTAAAAFSSLRSNDIRRRNIKIHKSHFGSKTSFQNQFLQKTNVHSKDNEEDEEEDMDAYNYQPSNDVIKSQSIEWIKKVVIGYNLCPFADQTIRENKLKVSVVRGNDDQNVAAAVVYELIARSDESQHGTTVVCAPEFYPDDFHRYMSLVQLLEDDVMEEHELHGSVQIAPFHPKFEFEGSGSDGIDNYTNRSPYPMFHILRENEVAAAVDKMGGDASKVWVRNVKLLERMEEKWGRDGTVKAMKGEAMDGIDTLLKELKLSTYNDDDTDQKDN